MRVLYVCTANICRSASAERLLRDAIAANPALAGVEVRSAGTHAIDGAPGCSMAPALVGHAAEHRSAPLSVEQLAWADLILAAARDHRAAVTALDPGARARTFTIRQAGRICDWIVEAGVLRAARERAAAEGAGSPESWTDRFEPGDPRAGVSALPADLKDRWRWAVAEMDAARGLASPLAGDRGHQVAADPVAGHPTGEPSGLEHPPGQPSGLEHLTGEPSGLEHPTGPRGSGRGLAPHHRAPGPAWNAAALRRRLRRFPRAASRGSTQDETADDIRDPDNVPDPHVLGSGLHGAAYEQLRESTQALVRLLTEVTR